VLELDDGQRLTEAATILLHVARRFPDARLLPEAGTIEEARAFEWLMWLTNTLHIAYACLWRPERFTEDAAARAALVTEAKGRIDVLNHEVEARLGDPSRRIGCTPSRTLSSWCSSVGPTASGWTRLGPIRAGPRGRGGWRTARR
jgi:glutathione S-transferase